MATSLDTAPPDGPPRSEARFRRRLGLLTTGALAARVAFLLLEPATHLVGDEQTWRDGALILASSRVAFSPLRNHLIFYPPGYWYFLAVFEVITGSLSAARWAQALLSVLLVPAVGRVGARALSPAAGLGAAALAAFYPELVWFSVHFWSETLFLVLLWWGIERLIAADEGGVGRAAAAGVLWALATLTRETVLYFIPAATAWLAFRRGRPGLSRAFAFALAACLVITPWTYRNWVVFHAFVPVSTAGGQNLFQGNALIPRDETYVMVDEVRGRVEQYRYAMSMGLRAIRDRQPWWIFEKLRSEMPHFWEADSLVLIHIKRGAYGEVAPWSAVGAAVVVLAPYVAVLALFVVGLATLVPTRVRVLLLLFLAYYNAIHIVTHGFARYRLPVLPVVFLFAAAGWHVLGAEGAAAALTPTRRAVAAALALLFTLTLVPSLRANLEHPAFGLTDSGGRAPGELMPPP